VSMKKTIVRVFAHPIKSSKKERSVFSVFKELLNLIIKKNGSLANDYAEAKVKKEHGDAELRVEEAAKISAKTNKIRQEEFKEFCKIIDNHFSENDTEVKKKLKMAKLIETNPTLIQEIEKLNSILLELNKSNKVEIILSNVTQADKNKLSANKNQT